MKTTLAVIQIIEQTGLSQQDVQALVEDKKSELKGLISEEGAILLVAKDLGVKIKDVKEIQDEQKAPEDKGHILSIEKKKIITVHVIDGVNRTVIYNNLSPCMECGALRLCCGETADCPVCDGLMTNEEYIKKVANKKDTINFKDISLIKKEVKKIVSEEEKPKGKGSWANEAKDRHVATGKYVVIVNGLDYRLMFDELYNRKVQDVATKKPKYMSPTETEIKYSYKVKLMKIGVANEAYAAVAKEEDPKKFEKALTLPIGDTYTLELSPSASKMLGTFVAANEEFLGAGGVFKMVRTGTGFKTKFVFSKPPQGVMPS